MYQVVGLSRRIGKYEGKEYDNTYVHCTRDGVVNDNENGLVVEKFKLKTAVFNAHPVSIGDDVTPMYNRFGQIERLWLDELK